MAVRKLTELLLQVTLGYLLLLPATQLPANAQSSAAADARSCLRQSQMLEVTCLLGVRAAGFRGTVLATAGRLCWQAGRARVQACRMRFIAARAAHPVSAELYGSAPPYDVPVLTTDRADYHPGDVITISGAGWQSWERVAIVLSVTPATHPDVHLTALADEDGNLRNTDYTVRPSDAGVVFSLTATGASGATAQTAGFTD